MSKVAEVSPKTLNALLSIPTPAVSNAIELLNVRPRNGGFMSPEVRCIFPDMGPVIGYAVTATISANDPPPEAHRVAPSELWEAVANTPSPRLMVLKDLDYPNVVGAFWGEVNANVHRALGAVGVVTDGSVRDLDEVRALGFQLFASCVTVSHAYVHLVNVGRPVIVGGLQVAPGDLLLGDKHGVINIPVEVADKIPDAERKVAEFERRVISLCQGQDFSIERLKEVNRARPY